MFLVVELWLARNPPELPGTLAAARRKALASHLLFVWRRLGKAPGAGQSHSPELQLTQIASFHLKPDSESGFRSAEPLSLTLNAAKNLAPENDGRYTLKP